MDLCWFEGDVLPRRDLEVAEEKDFSKVIMVEPDVRREGGRELAREGGS